MKFVIYMGKIIYGNFQNFAPFFAKNQHVVKLSRNGQHKKLAIIQGAQRKMIQLVLFLLKIKLYLVVRCLDTPK